MKASCARALWQTRGGNGNDSLLDNGPRVVAVFREIREKILVLAFGDNYDDVYCREPKSRLDEWQYFE